MMYMMKESSDAYSEQITDLFVGEPDFLIKGFQDAALGVQRALFVPTPKSTLSITHSNLATNTAQTGVEESL
jgi:hypothetical protein